MNLDKAKQTFIVEAQELLDAMEQALLGIEGGVDPDESVNAMFRAMHTIKGSAGLFGLDPIVRFAHTVESVMDRVPKNKIPLDPPLVRQMLECHDHLQTLIATTQEGVEEPPEIREVNQQLLNRASRSYFTHDPSPSMIKRPFMTLTPAVLALLLVTSLGANAEREEPRSSYQHEEVTKSHTVRPTSRGKKEKVVHAAPESKGNKDTTAHLKALEAENLRLREELARNNSGSGSLTAAPSATPEDALTELKAGNSRFVLGTRTRTQMSYNDMALRATLAKGQAPFAVIVTCSDSRLGDNFIFDQELGRLFTVREAGNCPDTQSLASIEYAVEHLGSKVVVVMGHESCGAVKAVLESGRTPLPGNLWSLQAAMAGLLESVHHPAGEPDNLHLSHLVEANALRQAKAVLTRSDMVRHLCQTGKLAVVPAVYDLASGQVSFLPAVSEGAPKAETHH